MTNNVTGITLNYDVVGVERLIKTFGNLPNTTQTKALRPAMRIGAGIIRRAAAANVKAITSSEATGLLSKSIRVYNFRRYRGMLRTAVMIQRGLVTTKGVRVGLYGSVLEYGKAGQPPRSWIRKALSDNVQKVYSTVRSEVIYRIESALVAARR